MQEPRDPCEPGSRRLPQAIQGPGQEANGVGLCWINKANRLLAEDPFVEMTVEEGVGDIKLSDRPPATCDEC